MMARRLGSTPFSDLLAPSIASDAAMSAAAEALDAVLRSSVAAIPRILLFARLANDVGYVRPVPMLAPLARLAELDGGLPPLTHAETDMLAWQLHVEGYDLAVSLAAKKQQVLHSLLLHRRRGTPWAVRRGVELALQLPVTVDQWFEYGGNPYFFRLRIDVSQGGWRHELLADVIKVAFAEKNVRSWLDQVRTESRLSLRLGYGLAVQSATGSQIATWMPVKDAPDMCLGLGFAVCGRSVSILIPHAEEHEPAGMPVHNFMAVTGHSSATLTFYDI